jgi:hypothetical protein
MRTRQQAPSRRRRRSTPLAAGSWQRARRITPQAPMPQDMRISYRFVCSACDARRDVALDCDASNVELYGSFIRCPRCMKTDRGNSALYWGFFALKVVAISALMGGVALATTPYLFVLVPLGLAGLWADHLRFLRKLDFAMVGARVSGGAAGERLPRP